MEQDVLEQIKEMLKARGKEELLEFAEDLAELGYEALKIVVDASETKLDDLVVASLDSVIKDFIDGIDGKED